MTRVLAIVQARMGSSRFPGKVLARIGTKPMIDLLLDRLAHAHSVDQIVVATTTSTADDPLVAHLERRGVPVTRGSDDDVLRRFVGALDANPATHVVRITGDCPLVDPGLVDLIVQTAVDSGVDYASNTDPPTYPDGLDVEVITAEALRRADAEATERHDREHVTPFIRRDGRYQRRNVQGADDASSLRWTVDEPEDLAHVAAIAERLKDPVTAPWTEIRALATTDPALVRASAPRRNEGASMGEGQKLWRRAQRVIPGGNMLLSKRPEMFLPDAWPAYFSQARGCRVTDIDGRTFIDVSLMGVGTNTLGYGHPEVDAAVRRVIDEGNMSTLNCPEEVLLAERLTALHPWSDMARFARSGGEANAIAIRIGRAASGRDGVAICGYHGWHDWYLAANLADDANLDGHLLPGLEPRGVPRELRGSVYPFSYNDLDGLRDIVTNHEVGVIKMEVERNVPPKPGFLEGVRSLADRHGIVLIFDECTSGFRSTFGGLHLAYGVDPDIAVFGKALGNGYAITAAIGREAVMQEAQRTFISSTFWTERIGPAAALAALDVMDREHSWETITAVGKRVVKTWSDLADRHAVPISHAGIPPLAAFSFDIPYAAALKSFLTQEMLHRGFLASTALYASVAHTDDVLAMYEANLEAVFARIATLHDEHQVLELLEGPVCHTGFARLN